MELPFTHLVSTRIVRMQRPQVALTSVTDPSMVPQVMETAMPESADSDLAEIQCMSEVAEEKWGTENMLVFQSKFGRTYVGQTFHGIVNIYNLSKAYTLTDVQIRGILSLQSKATSLANQVEFLNAKMAEIPANGSWTPSVEIPISEVDTYILYLEIHYSSDFYKKELDRVTQPERYASKTANYSVLPGKKVIMSFQKRYRFESTNPFTIVDKVHRTSENGYLAQLVLESNIQGSACISEAKFIAYKDFELIPVSKEMEQVFEKSQSLRTGDKRAYAFVLKRTKEPTPEDLLQYYKLGGVELGRLQVTWVGSFGDTNSHYSKIVTAQHCTPTEVFTVKMLSPPERLYMEEPQTISLRFTNTSPNVFRLKLYVKEEESKALGINALSHQELSKVQAYQSFEIQILVYPKFMGIQRLAGLHAIDLVGKADINFGVIGEFLVEERPPSSAYPLFFRGIIMTHIKMLLELAHEGQ